MYLFIELKNEIDNYVSKIHHPHLQQIDRSYILDYRYKYLYDNYLHYIRLSIFNSNYNPQTRCDKIIRDILIENIYDHTVILHLIINIKTDINNKLKFFNVIVNSYIDVIGSNPITLFLIMYSHFTQLVLDKHINLKELLRTKTELILIGNKIGMNTKPIKEIMTVDVHRK